MESNSFKIFLLIIFLFLAAQIFFRSEHIDVIEKDSTTSTLKNEIDSVENTFIHNYKNTVTYDINNPDILQPEHKFLYKIEKRYLSTSNILEIINPIETIVSLFDQIRKFKPAEKNDFETKLEFEKRYNKSLNDLAHTNLANTSYVCLGTVHKRYNAEDQRWLLHDIFSSSWNSFSRTSDLHACSIEYAHHQWGTHRLEIDFLRDSKEKDFIFENEHYSYEIPMIPDDARKIKDIGYAIIFKINLNKFPIETLFFSSIERKERLTANVNSLIFFDNSTGKILLLKSKE